MVCGRNTASIVSLICSRKILSTFGMPLSVFRLSGSHLQIPVNMYFYLHTVPSYQEFCGWSFTILVFSESWGIWIPALPSENSCQGIYSSTLGRAHRNEEKWDHGILTLICKSCLSLGLCYFGHTDAFGCCKEEAVTKKNPVYS